MQSNGIDGIAKRFGVRLIVQFGSSVSQRLHDHSDLDIAVLLEEASISLSERAELQHSLQELFPERELDLALINRADPLFLKQVTTNCRLLYGEPLDFYELKIYAFRRYQDHKRFLAMERDFAIRFVRQMRAST